MRLLIWETGFKSAEKFDRILIADCLYYVKYHEALIHVMKEIMHKDSICVIVAAKRGVTMDQFMERLAATKAFGVEVSEHICEEVDQKIAEIKTQKLYRETEHKPYLVKIRLAA